MKTLDVKKVIHTFCCCEGDDKAYHLYEEYSQEFPFPVDDFARSLDIKLYEASLKIGEVGYIEYYRQEELQEWRIVVDKEDGYLRKRFTIAHELGHYFFRHLDKKSQDRVMRRDYFKTFLYKDYNEAQEVQANAFAAAMLMPEEIFRKVYKESSGDVWYLSSYFGVSPTATSFRIVNLKLDFNPWI